MRDFHESSADADVVVVEGLAHSSEMPLEPRSTCSSSELSVLRLSWPDRSPDCPSRSSRSVWRWLPLIRGTESGTIIGCIINHVPDPKSCR